MKLRMALRVRTDLAFCCYERSRNIVILITVYIVPFLVLLLVKKYLCRYLRVRKDDKFGFFQLRGRHGGETFRPPTYWKVMAWFCKAILELLEQNMLWNSCRTCQTFCIVLKLKAHHVTMELCNHVTMWSCNYVTIWPCNHGPNDLE
jgi:hypothetical protein